MSSSGANKWKFAFTLILVIFILNTGVLLVAFMNQQNRLESIQTTLNEQSTELQDLQNQLEILDVLGNSGVMPWPTIYNQLKDSVVLIQTNLGLGSGFIFDKQGHIVTNHHVIEDAETIQVMFLDGNITSAKVVGTDIYSDLAVIKVDAKVTTLNPIVLGTSSDLSVGEPVAAMGNPFGLSDTLTVGIVSSLQRTMDATGGYMIIDIIQIDAAVNPGNSGGPLVNIIGQVVGVNSAIQSDTGVFTGIGFAIPSDTVKREIDQLIENGEYKHPWLGISALEVNILVIDVASGSPADQAGLRGGDEVTVLDGVEVNLGGDVITQVDGVSVITMDDLAVYLERNTKPRDTVKLGILRDNQEMSLMVTLGERPEP
jgi:S1-C subfamily serine protease